MRGDETLSTYTAGQLLRDLWQWLRPYRWRFIVASILRAITDVVWLFPAYAIAQIVTSLSNPALGIDYHRLESLFGLWALASIIHFGGRQIAKYIAYTTAERVALDVSLQTMRHLFALDLAWHERENAGNKVKRVQRGERGIDDILRMWIDNAIEATVNFIGVGIVLANFDPVLAWAMASFLVAYYALSVYLTRQAIEAANRVNVREETVSGLTFEAVNNVRSAKVLGFVDAIYGRIRREVSHLFKDIRERVYRFRSRSFIQDAFGQSFRFGVLIFIVLGIIRGQYEAGLLILVYDYFNRVWRSIDEIAEQTQRFTLAQYAIGRMTAILGEPLGIAAAGTKNFPSDWKELRVDNVSFQYSDRRVLRNISLRVRKGERIGIVGVSGAGKSTLFKLLLKEHATYDGQIFVDDVPLQEISQQSYSQKTAVVLQETEVFNFTLRENIAIANERYARDTARLDRAVTVSHVKDFLARLGDGLDTAIGEKGVRLSGGEKQRVGIARAIFKEPEILFMDEATSHLDSESEAKIQDSLHKVFQSVTAVVIAHRLSTIREMDRIYVLEKGSVVEEGSFQQLLRKKGRFAQMWERQQF